MVLWVTEEYATTAAHRMQLALDKISAWTEKWCLQINKDKSASTLFTLSQQKPQPLTLGGVPLQHVDEQIYLGVNFDKRQTWKAHIEFAESKARKKLNSMRKLAGTTWGANEKILKQVYHGNIRPSLEFGSGAYMSAATSQLNNLEKVQNQALRVITGAMRSTPIEKMQKITGIQPLRKRMESKALMMFTKAKALKDHPMHERTKQRGQGRLKRTSFMGQAKALQEKFKENLPEEVEEIKLKDDWREAPDKFKIKTSVPDLGSKEVTSKEERKLMTLEMIEDSYHEEAWTHIFTDGSASDAVKNGGAGVYIHEKDGSTKVLAEATGVYCTNYRAEVEALIIAAEDTKYLSRIPDCIFHRRIVCSAGFRKRRSP